MNSFFLPVLCDARHEIVPVVLIRVHMNKVIDIKLTSIFSPICQALIHESSESKLAPKTEKLISNNNDLLIIRLDNTVIGYALFEAMSDGELILDYLYFRDIIKDHTLAEYWLTRFLKRYLKNGSYSPFSFSR